MSDNSCRLLATVTRGYRPLYEFDLMHSDNEDVIMNIKALIQCYPVVSFFVLAYVISWGGCFAAAGPKLLRSETLQPIDAPLLFLPMLAGPSTAGITMTYIADGKSGLQNLFFRMSTWQVGVPWYAVALLLPPVLILAVLLTLTTLLSPGFSPGVLPRLSPAGARDWSVSWILRGDRLDGICLPEDGMEAQRLRYKHIPWSTLDGVACGR